MRRALAACLSLVAVLGGCDFNGHDHPDPGAPPGYQIEVSFPSLPRSVDAGTPVRIAGIDVGKVTAVRRGKRDVLAATLEPKALPVYRDAVVKLRPRIFQEGAYFVDLEPGTARAPPLPDGGRLTGTQPVSYDQVLKALEHDKPKDLREFVKRYAKKRR